MITTHVLDTAAGRPGAGVDVSLETRDVAGTWVPLAAGATDENGRLGDMLPPGETLAEGVHRLVFDTAAYFTARGLTGFFPEVSVVFQVIDPAEHYHVPLLLSPYGYSTYRGT